MSYTYLVDLYEAIGARIADIDGAGRSTPHEDAAGRQYLAGRRDCLEAIHRFLEEHYDHKLPRRLQGRSRLPR